MTLMLTIVAFKFVITRDHGEIPHRKARPNFSRENSPLSAKSGAKSIFIETGNEPHGTTWKFQLFMDNSNLRLSAITYHQRHTSLCWISIRVATIDKLQGKPKPNASTRDISSAPILGTFSLHTYSLPPWFSKISLLGTLLCLFCSKL